MPYDLDLSQVLMTLNALSYESENPLPNETLAHHQQRILSAIQQDLANPAYATAGNWELVWGPGLTVGNMMYLTREIGTNNYALSIRGTDWKFIIDWIEDADVLQLVPFPYISSSNANIRVAKGTMDGLMALASMTARALGSAMTLDPSSTPMSLLQFLSLAAMSSSRASLNVFVTGHSLGGALASVVGPWLDYQTSQWHHTGNTSVTVEVYAYAGPSAGNADFAQYVGGLLVDGYFRVFNTLDVVPRAWQQLGEVATWYDPAPMCPLIVKGAIDIVEHAIAGDVYTQPDAAEPYPNLVNAAEKGSFWRQLAYQHDQNTYLSLLGAPPVSIDEDGFNARVAASLNAFATSMPNIVTDPLRATQA